MPAAVGGGNHILFCDSQRSLPLAGGKKAIICRLVPKEKYPVRPIHQNFLSHTI
jgi:hypothetical protein